MQSFVVIGLGQFGRHVAVTLGQLGHEVLAIDTDMGRVEEVKDLVTRAVRADAAQEHSMRSLGVEAIGTGIVALGEDDFEAAVLTVSVLRQLGVQRIWARSSNAQRGRILSIVGAHQLIYPEVEMGERVARTLAAPGVVDQRTLPSGQTLAEVKVPSPFVGKTIEEAALREKFKVIVVSIQRGGTQAEPDPARMLEPRPDERFEADDVLLVVGDRASIEAFCRRR